MRSKLVLTALALVVAAGAISLSGAAPLAVDDPADSPSIVGTYKLVSRDLPDGTTVTPPDIAGMVTFTDEYRNFNVYWRAGEGHASISYVARYSLSDEEYSETAIYFMANDPMSGSRPTYDLSGPSGNSPVQMTDDGMKIDLPLWNEPVVVFSGDKMTATREGEFVDHWEKVK
ncbi:MAG: hypothetical protein GWN99_18045 [Gemmatimonadetes bacterium]|uniref:Lipocalin-like domain-containing protein n=1 Tax=Candidatus Kutchimonas denitrificans TaxID=3056748 RepID=A0AAE4Z8J4_9BACT|nr:hypothetical protein [Gemmatimonadota bacterium]NIR75638.1 hypothetical protein [Candidatus Kutchimonas denitrificans]NIS02938.1 hypothetical protein [Gemmatimonadota bacterium]NIT68660.1 hypothetical protein [Gemmatimonadota bacterium]NIV25339.1 hypothetical protein [Gemmatimonadota bacterium]